MHDAISCEPIAPVHCSTCACVHTVRASSASRSISTPMPTPRWGGVARRRYQAMPAPGVACRRGCSAVRPRHHRLARNRDGIGAHDNQRTSMHACSWVTCPTASRDQWQPGSVSRRAVRTLRAVTVHRAVRQRWRPRHRSDSRRTSAPHANHLAEEVRHADVQRRIACAAARDSGIPDHIAGRATAVTGRKLAALGSRLAGQV